MLKSNFGAVDIMRRELFAKHGGDPSTLPSTMTSMSNMRLIQSSIDGWERPIARSPLIARVGPLLFDSSATMASVDSMSNHERVVKPFIDHAERVVLLAFGSTAMPSPAFIGALIRGVAKLFEQVNNIET
jgi:hypothetical protein